MSSPYPVQGYRSPGWYREVWNKFKSLIHPSRIAIRTSDCTTDNRVARYHIFLVYLCIHIDPGFPSRGVPDDIIVPRKPSNYLVAMRYLSIYYQEYFSWWPHFRRDPAHLSSWLPDQFDGLVFGYVYLHHGLSV